MGTTATVTIIVAETEGRGTERPVGTRARVTPWAQGWVEREERGMAALALAGRVGRGGMVGGGEGLGGMRGIEGMVRRPVLGDRRG